MKLIKQSLLITAIVSALVAQSVLATPLSGTVTDEYWGSDDHGYGDVIGNSNLFDVFSIDWSLDGTELAITVKTNFADNGLGTFANYTKADPNGTICGSSEGPAVCEGISYGDLFLSDHWTPVGTAVNKYDTDDMYQTGTTDWDYGFSLDNRYENGGTGTWYDLTGVNNAEGIYDSDAFLENATWRNDQAVAVNRSSAATELYSTTWDVNSESDPGGVTFTFDIAGTTLETSDTIGFHWAMSCGNDTIEGMFNKPVATPEPGTLMLLTLGLLGLLRMRKTAIANRANI